MGAIGVDIGGTKTLVALVSHDGRVLERRSAPTPAAEGPAAVVKGAVSLLSALDAPAGLPIGVGAAGTVDPDSGVVRYATDHLPGWTGTPVRDELTAHTGRRVVVENDVAAAAVGEWWAGAGRDRDSVLLVAVGTGIGAGLLTEAGVFRGSHGASMEIAHLPVPTTSSVRCGCGRTGHLESVASGTALASAYAELTGRTGITGADVARLAEGGSSGAPDADAATVISTAGAVLGTSLAGLVAMLDPEVVILTGGAGEALRPSTERAFRAALLAPYAHVPLRPGALGADGVAVGAARLAMGEVR